MKLTMFVGTALTDFGCNIRDCKSRQMKGQGHLQTLSLQRSEKINNLTASLICQNTR